MDFHLVSDVPAPMYVGGFPRDYGDVPARVIVNLSGMYRSFSPHQCVLFSYPFHDSVEAADLPVRRDVERLLASIDVFAASEPSFWHCAAGYNRSGFVAAAYLHLYRELPVTTAIALLRQKRSPMVLCNSLFEGTLLNWYGTELERATVQPAPPRG